MTKQNHPDKDQLLAFGLGKLVAAEAERIAQHLDDCDTCSETLVDLADDTFVVLVRQSPAPERGAATAEPATVGVASVSDESSGDLRSLPPELRDHPRYEIQQLIGKGGMGDVYRARHRLMDRTVALKVIRGELVRKPEAVDRFQREVKAAARLTHKNVVTAYDAEQAGDLHFLAMEYVDGINLHEAAHQCGPLPITEACSFIQQAAQGLQYAHERGMVHRDIKPHNLMLTAEGTVKILDFGLASLTREAVLDAGGGAITDSDLTAAGAIMGTPDYISPEQALDARQADIRSDIYSLGATLYFLLTGRPPFAEGNVLDRLKSLAHSEPPSPRSLRNDIPIELSTVVMRMIAKDPDQRFQTPREIATALEPFAQSPETISNATQETKPIGEPMNSTAQPLAPVQPIQNGGRTSLLTARALSAVLLLGIALMFLDVMYFGDAIDDASSDRIEYYVAFVLIMSTFSGLAYAVHGLQSTPVTAPANVQNPSRTSVAITVLIFVALVAGIVYYIQLDEGVVIVEVDDPYIEVTLAGRTITQADGKGETKIQAGEHALTVQNPKTRLEFETPKFEVRRGDKVVFKVELLADAVVVQKDGQPFERVQQPVAQTDTDSRLELSIELARGFGEVDLRREDLEKNLFNSISRGAGIPNKDWEKVAREGAMPDAIQGEPLSKVLLLSDAGQDKAADDPEIPSSFRLLTDGWPKPLDLHQAMALSQPEGYVSVIQPAYITKAKLWHDTKTKMLSGTAWFEAPGLYAGQVDFAQQMRNGRMEVVEFVLRDRAIKLVRNQDDVWERKPIDGAATDNKAPGQ